jgi:DNA-binding LacI/PurR family transcriptional regulator
VMVMSDELARPLLEEAAAQGLRIPDDIAITGWDDDPSAAQLGLTTVSQDLRAQGAICARLALGRQTENPHAPWHVVHRTTTRPA